MSGLKPQRNQNTKLRGKALDKSLHLSEPQFSLVSNGETPTVINPNEEKLKAILLKSGMRQGFTLHQLLFNMVFKILAGAMRKEREN